MRFCAILVLVLLLACNNKNQEKRKTRKPYGGKAGINESRCCFFRYERKERNESRFYGIY